MSKRRIPKPQLANTTKNIPQPTFLSSMGEDKVVFSFAPLEWTEYFNFEGTCQNWSFDLFNMLKSISMTSKVELLSGKFRTYRVHDHEKASPPNPLPDGVALKDCYQLRISTSKGGIHGVFVENTFYVIWVDLLHNMYPDDRFGGLRTIKPPNTCCKDREIIIGKLQEENEKLKEENKFWENELAKI